MRPGLGKGRSTGSSGRRGDRVQVVGRIGKPEGRTTAGPKVLLMFYIETRCVASGLLGCPWRMRGPPCNHLISCWMSKFCAMVNDGRPGGELALSGRSGMADQTSDATSGPPRNSLSITGFLPFFRDHMKLGDRTDSLPNTAHNPGFHSRFVRKTGVFVANPGR